MLKTCDSLAVSSLTCLLQIQTIQIFQVGLARDLLAPEQFHPQVGHHIISKSVKSASRERCWLTSKFSLKPVYYKCKLSGSSELASAQDQLAPSSFTSNFPLTNHPDLFNRFARKLLASINFNTTNSLSSARSGGHHQLTFLISIR